MTKPLLSNSQMASIQRLAESGMQVDVVLKRPIFGSDDLGDGAFDKAPEVVARCKGYLRQTGGDTTGDADVGSIGTSSTYELGVPVGTNAHPRDIAEINGKTYYVQDVRDDETWPAMTNLLLRRRE